MAVTAEQWKQLREIFSTAIEYDSQRRVEYLDEVCAGDPRLREEIESLLASHDDAEDFIEDPAVPESFRAIRELPVEQVEGRRIGSYRLLAEIGRGGMGIVYLAERDDAQFKKLVAIKIVRRGMDTEDILRRFRNERQILASLEHPNIAGLLDGGTTVDGRPYLVMEFVEGTPVTQYCDHHRLPTVERLQLFRTICAAVQHAHQHLVVHRDLKPSNILITPEGVPKLLDFGIAKVLASERSDVAEERTRTEFRALTPDYASPEQVRGENLTTTSDVYSLGVLLYELLTGHRPYRSFNAPSHELARIICEQEPPKPSAVVNNIEVVTSIDSKSQTFITPESVSQARDTQPDKLRRGLTGDLDNIVLMALRKEPHRRYESAAQFSTDIQRHLEGLPVIAHKDTLVYRGAKFARRHRFGVLAACLLVMTLTAGLFATLWQWQNAKTERVRAESLFNNVRHLANSFMFEFHDSIVDLPGSTPARELVVKRALDYLDRLSQDSHADPSLQLELATAYQRVGDVQGNPNNANLGDPAGAIESYRKALAIVEPLLQVRRTDSQGLQTLAIVHGKISETQAVIGDIPGAIENAQKSLEIFKRLSENSTTDIESQQTLAVRYIKLGDVQGNPNFPNAGDQASAMTNYQYSSEILTALYAADPSDQRTRRLLGLIYERLGTLQEIGGRLEEALDTYSKSLALREALAQDFPMNTDAVRDAAIAHEKIGNIMSAKGNLETALQSRRRALEIFESLVKVDPQNVQAQQSLAISYVHLGDLFGYPDGPNMENHSEALNAYRQALEILENTRDTASVKTRATLGIIHERIGTIRAGEGKFSDALVAYRASLNFREPFLTDSQPNVAMRREIGTLYEKFGQLYLDLATAGLTPFERKGERLRQAKGWFQKSLDTWVALEGGNKLSESDTGKVEELKTMIAKCDSLLAS